MKVKKAYYYLFYTFWGFFESSPTKWGTTWKAGALIIILEIFIVFSTLNFYSIFFNDYFDLQLSSPELIIPVIAILIINYRAFSGNDWQSYAIEFNGWSRKKNLIASTLVLFFVIIVITLLISSFCMIKPVASGTASK